MNISKSFSKVILNILLVAAFLCAFIFFASCNSNAYTEYTTEKYDVKVDVARNNTYQYTETIVVNFNTAKHGIYRNIPFSKNYRIKNISVDGYKYSLSNENNNRVIKIGSAEKYLTGRHVFTIRYTIVGLKNSSVEEMNIDVIPTGWLTPIENATAVVNLPEDMKWKDIKFYSAAYGGKDSKYGTWKVSDNKQQITFSGSNLPKGVGASLRAELPDNYWQNQASNEWLKLLAEIIVILVLLLTIILRITLGRNPKVVEPVCFYPPKGFTPVDIGYVIDGTVDKKDITSLIFYMADKGYIAINEYAKKSFDFEALKYPEDEKPAIKSLYEGLFGKDSFIGMRVVASSVGEQLGKAYQAIPDDVDDEFQGEKKIFTKKSKAADIVSKLAYVLTIVSVTIIDILYQGRLQGGILFAGIVGVILAIVSFLMLSGITHAYYKRYGRKGTRNVLNFVSAISIYIVFTAIYSYIVCASTSYGFGESTLEVLIVIFLIVIPFLVCGMRSRSEWSADILGQILGFKRFIAEAELDKMNELVEENPSYFFNVLPYAYVFGLTKKWASKFENIEVSQPEWYTPYGDANISVFDIVILNSLVHNVSHNIDSNIVTIPDSGDIGFGDGGGFGGGGFSGGGFGGGGGGAW